jgi:VanZ family protein
MFLGFLVVGLWPFDFSPANEVSWLNSRNGIRFKGRGSSWFSAGGVVFCPRLLASPWTTESEKESVSIEIWLRPNVVPKKGSARILSLYTRHKTDVLYIDQWESDLRLFYAAASPPGKTVYRKIQAGEALTAGKGRFITITSGASGTSIYLEGRRVRNFPDVHIDVERNIFGRILMIGNSLDAGYPWSGDLFALAIYNRSLSNSQVARDFKWWQRGSRPIPPDRNGLIALYAFSEKSGRTAHNAIGNFNNISIPDRLKFEKRILRSPDLSHLHIPDITVNILGFIPFGFFLSWWLSEFREGGPLGKYLVVILIGALVSLVIEVTQVYLPTRDSSQMDLICNTLGTALGVVLFPQFRGLKKASVRQKRQNL